MNGSGNGTYIQEPSNSYGYAWFNQPNWCGPGSATAILLHWGYNTVVNGGTYAAPVDPLNNSAFDNYYAYSGQGWVNYGGPWGYMTWLATQVFGNGTGVVTYTWNNNLVTGVNTYMTTQASGLNQALNNMGYGNYYFTKTYTSSQEGLWISDGQFDIGHDGRPMILRGDARQFPWWNGYTGGSVVNHVIMNYGYDSNGFYIADTASWQDGSSIAGDHYASYGQLWYAETQASSGAYVNQ